ncbi:hypothetical protein [Actinomadura sp. 9N215]|uniref:hypothetical protein n=1 Tax=Actinomadura sp. 9N215 TaxID=3375150 RepID=UPI00379084DA
MSGHGGSSPPNWESPQGGTPGWDPSGQGGQPGPGYGYGPPGVPPRTVSNGTITAALVCNSIAIVLCLNIAAVAGVITALHAQRRITTDPRSAWKLTIWSWSLFALSVVIGIAVVVFFLTIGADS